MRLDEDMRPRRFPIGGWMIVVGIIVLAIGIISLVAVGGIGHYIKYEDVLVEEQAENVTKIKIDSASVDIKIVNGGQTDKITYEGKDVPTDYIGFEIDGDTAKIYKKKKSFSIIGFGSLNMFGKETKITLTVPDKLYDELDMDAGAGTIKLDGFKVEKADLDCGAGDFSAENCKFDKLDMDCGAGNIDILDCEIGSLDLDCGAGNVKFSGKLTEKGKIDCGAGDVDIRIDGAYMDYDLDVDKGIGDVNIEKGSAQGTGADIPLDIDCGAGDVDISFK